MFPTPDALLAALRARGIEPRLTGNRLQVFTLDGTQAWTRLTTEEQAGIRQHRAALKALLTGQPVPQVVAVAEPVAEVVPEPDAQPATRNPEPELYVRKVRVTADDVRACLANYGMTAEDMSMDEAYRMTQRWLRNSRRHVLLGDMPWL